MEIERKFLTTLKKDTILDDLAKSGFEVLSVYQIDKITLIRDENGSYIRVTKKTYNDYVDYLLASKGPANISRLELEVEISKSQYDSFHNEHTDNVETKIRYVVTDKSVIWELDIFSDGLILAEVELSQESQIIEIPNFISQEVTDDLRYYNYSTRGKL